MDLNEYQKQTEETAIYPKDMFKDFNEGFDKLGLLYVSIGLSGECGEYLENVKKMIRDDGGVISQYRRKEMIYELGDIFWYLARIASELEIDLATIAENNINKLKKRYGK